MMKPIVEYRKAYCWRCDDVVETRAPWPHWQKVKIGWFATVGTMMLGFPILSSDFCVMIPSMMAIIIAGSPIFRYASELPSCCTCSAVLDPKRHAGTGVRAKQPRSNA